VGLLVGTVLLLAGLDALQQAPGREFDLVAALGRVLQPADVAGWLQIAGALAFALVGGLFIAAARARRAEARRNREAEPRRDERT
jgi:hypothetical protein